jgi:hypothetical protein
VNQREISLALDGAVDRGSSDTEELGHFGGAVLTARQQRDKVSLLATVQFGLLAAQVTFGSWGRDCPGFA